MWISLGTATLFVDTIAMVVDLVDDPVEIPNETREPDDDYLIALARAHDVDGVSTDELLGGPPASDPRVRGEPITRDGLTMWPLTNRASGGLRTFKIRIGTKRRRAVLYAGIRVTRWSLVRHFGSTARHR